MRLFIAIEFTPPVRTSLCAVMDGLRRQGVSGTYTAPDNLHLTLVPLIYFYRQRVGNAVLL